MFDSKAENTEAQAEVISKEENKFDQMIEKIEASKQEAQEVQESESSEEKTQESGEAKMDWEKAYKNVQAEKDKFLSTAEKAARLAVEKDPEAIHDLAKVDRTLADRIIKSELGKEGIKSYDELVAHIEKQNKTNDLDEPTKNVYEKVVKPLEEKLTVLEQKQLEKEKAEADLFMARFKEEHPDFEGELEKQCWEFFDRTGLPLQEVYDYVKFKQGKSEDLSKVEEKVYQKMAQSKVAGSISPSGSKATAPKAGKTYTAKELGFLSAMGVKK